MMVAVGLSPQCQVKGAVCRGATREMRSIRSAWFNRRSATVAILMFHRGLKPTAAVGVSLRDARERRLASRTETNREPLQTFDLPPLAVLASKHLAGLGQIELQFGCVPLQRGLRKARRYAAQQDGFRQRSGIIKACGRLAVASAGLGKLGPMGLPRQGRG